MRQPERLERLPVTAPTYTTPLASTGPRGENEGGAPQASVVSNGIPRCYGFPWSERTGLVLILITDLKVSWEQADEDYRQASDLRLRPAPARRAAHVRPA